MKNPLFNLIAVQTASCKAIVGAEPFFKFGARGGAERSRNKYCSFGYATLVSRRVGPTAKDKAVTSAARCGYLLYYTHLATMKTTCCDPFLISNYISLVCSSSLPLPISFPPPAIFFLGRYLYSPQLLVESCRWGTF